MALPVIPPTVPAGVDEIRPPRWSWVHWWEANRDLYLVPLRQATPGQGPEQRIIDRSRKRAVEALFVLIEDAHPGLRAAAVAALGRIGRPEAHEVLNGRATRDPVPAVRHEAVMALGLLDTPDAEASLLEPQLGNPQNEPVLLAALGLLTNPGDHNIGRVNRAVSGPDPKMGSIAACAAKRRRDRASRTAMQAVLTRSTSAWLASEAILSLGHTGGPGDIPFLTDILLGRPGARGVLAYKTLEDSHRLIMKQFEAHLDQVRRYDQAKKVYDVQLEQWMQRQARNPAAGNVAGPPPTEPVRPEAKYSIICGVEWTYASELRGSAAIALGMIDHLESRRALMAALALPDDYYSDLFKAHAIMSLGQIADGDCLPVLVAMLEPRNSTPDQFQSPLRGYAALALGLYGRPMQTDQGPVDRPNVVEALEILVRHMSDRNETMEVRTACALALGLTQRTENLPALQRLGALAAPGEELLLGYSLLARGLLGDLNILEPARRFLLQQRDRVDMSGILARRAAVLGLGLLDRQEAVPILREAWHLNYYVNREVILALALSGSTGIGNTLVDLLQESNDPEEKAYFALCLGELLTPSRPPRLAWFINLSNYMMKNESRLPFQTMANEFLFNYLIAAFGNEWR
jgi:HEAT repeat protein